MEENYDPWSLISFVKDSNMHSAFKKKKEKKKHWNKVDVPNKFTYILLEAIGNQTQEL